MVNKITTPPTQKDLVDKTNEIIDNKSDIDLANVNDTGKIASSSWAMPSTSYETLTAGATGTVYTAPSNGYFVANATTNSTNNTNHMIVCKLMDDAGTNEICAIGSDANLSSNISPLVIFVPLKKNDKCKLEYSRMASVTVGFIYATGSESEQS